MRLLLCLLLGSAGLLQAADLWTGAPSDFSQWKVTAAGGVEADGKVVDDALVLSSTSPVAAGKWLSVSANKSFPVTAGNEITLHLNIEAVNAGRVFAAVVFSPVGGQSRFYLPTGTYPAKDFEQTMEVPVGARLARVIFGVESETQSVAIKSVSVDASAVSRTNLSAQWQPRPGPRVFPQVPKPADDLVALDVSRLSGDEVMLATTLEGLINRTQPRIYLYYTPYDHFWAKWLLDQHYIHSMDDMPNLASLLDRFHTEIAGAIVYDHALPASRHAAVMLGAIKGYPATSAATAKKYNLKIEENLTGRWKRNIDAYRELWTKYRSQFASHMLAVYNPLMVQQGPRDYLVQQKIFTFWVSGYADNDVGGDPAAELNFAHEVLAATPPNIPVLGWFSFGENQGVPEYDAVNLCSSYAKFLVCSEYCSNVSVLSGISVPPETFVQRPTPPAKPLDDHVAATLSVLDSGDAQWYWQSYQSKIWQDPARGRVPINWCLNPTVLDVMPPVLAWFYLHATPKDLFFCAMSGLGYMDPRTYGSRFKPEDRKKIWKEYTGLLSTYLKALDLHIQELYAGSWDEPRGGVDAVYDRYFKNVPELTAILSDFGRNSGTTPENAIEVIDGKPVFHTQMRWIAMTLPDEINGQLKQEQQSVDFTVKEFLDNEPKERPAFMSGLVLSWTMSPSLVERVADKLPPDVNLMNADTMVEEFNLQSKK